MKILLTGATGFLGSHIAENFFNQGFELILTKRTNSKLDNCQSFMNHATWINTDTTSWMEDVKLLNPTIIIHAAWNGVTSTTRDDWESQLSNIGLMYQLLQIAKCCKVDKFISLGSQAEYGQIEGKIAEDYPVNPTSCYGSVKLAVSEMLKVFCDDNNIKWYWLRVFSVFGERENENWLIPSVIKKMNSGSTDMDFTLGEQKYAYLYVRDFASAIHKVVVSNASSGVFNLSSDYPVSLKQLLQTLKDQVNPNFTLNFGALSYRPNQSMHIEGDATKFNDTFGKIDTTDFEVKLSEVVDFYKN